MVHGSRQYEHGQFGSGRVRFPSSQCIRISNPILEPRTSNLERRTRALNVRCNIRQRSVGGSTRSEAIHSPRPLPAFS